MQSYEGNFNQQTDNLEQTDAIREAEAIAAAEWQQYVADRLEKCGLKDFHYLPEISLNNQHYDTQQDQ